MSFISPESAKLYTPDPANRFFAKFKGCELIGKQNNGTTDALKQAVWLFLVFTFIFAFFTIFL